jgi:hypothetical protein
MKRRRFHRLQVRKKRTYYLSTTYKKTSLLRTGAIFCIVLWPMKHRQQTGPSRPSSKYVCVENYLRKRKTNHARTNGTGAKFCILCLLVFWRVLTNETQTDQSPSSRELLTYCITYNKTNHARHRRHFLHSSCSRLASFDQWNIDRQVHRHQVKNREPLLYHYAYKKTNDYAYKKTNGQWNTEKEPKVRAGSSSSSRISISYVSCLCSITPRDNACTLLELDRWILFPAPILESRVGM